MNTPAAASQARTPGFNPCSQYDEKDDLKSLPLLELQKKLESSAGGLSQSEAQKRLSQYGPNKLEEKQTNAFLKFITYFWGAIHWMSEADVILLAVAQHWPDFGIIRVLLVANAVGGSGFAPGGARDSETITQTVCCEPFCNLHSA